MKPDCEDQDQQCSIKYKSDLYCSAGVFLARSRAIALIKRAPSWIQTRKRLGERRKPLFPSQYAGEFQYGGEFTIASFKKNACTAGYRGSIRSLLVTYQEHKAQVQKPFEVFKGAGREQGFRILMNPGS